MIVRPTPARTARRAIVPGQRVGTPGPRSGRLLRVPEVVRRSPPRLLGPHRGAATGSGSRLVICGDDQLALRIVEELTQRYHRPVTVVLRSAESGQGPRIARLPGIRLIETPALDAAAFAAAAISGAEAVALVAQDDVGNLHAALAAYEINPRLRLVVRMFNSRFGDALRGLVRDCHVLSDASLAAPAFVASALGEVAPTYVRLAGRTLYVARRSDVPQADVLAGLADTAAGPAPVLLPPDQGTCDIVLAVAHGGARLESQDGELARVREPATRRQRLAAAWRSLAAGRIWRELIGRTLRVTALVLVGILAVATLFLFLIDPHLSIWQAGYVTVLNTVGGANYDFTLSGAEQALQTVMAVVGLALVPVLTAAVVDGVVKAELALALGRQRKVVRDHVVVVGLGNVGTRVIGQLRDLGVPVVAIDKQESARGTQLARDRRIPLIIGDASRTATLREASVATARALVATSTDDVVNLEAALHAQALNPDLRIVLRLFDGDLAARVQRAFGIASSKSVSFLAAPAFTAAILEREVNATIPIKRQVLLISEVAVEPGSGLDGAVLAKVAETGQVRVIAITAGRTPTRWAPSVQVQVRAGDRLFVVATREGLGKMAGLATAVAPAETRAEVPPR